MLSADVVMGDTALPQGVAFQCGGAGESAICKPKESTTLSQFVAMQHEVNRVAAALGTGKFLQVDGDIGPATAKRVRELAQMTKSWVPREMLNIPASEMHSALDLALPEMVSKFAVGVQTYMRRAVEQIMGENPDAVGRVREYDRQSALTAPGQTSPSSPSPAPAGGPKRSKLPWVVGGVGAALAIGLGTAAVVLSRRKRGRRR